MHRSHRTSSRVWTVPAVALVAGCMLATGCRSEQSQDARQPWIRHTIDAASIGADGIRLADVNADGRLDIATAWEEGGGVRVYTHPGPQHVRKPWPRVTVGQVDSPEDAVLADLDADGAVDVISSCEGNDRTLYVHWAPTRQSEFLDAGAWQTQPIPPSRGMMQWMFALPLQLDGRNGLDLVAGGKNTGACIGWFAAPPNARNLTDWVWHPLYEAGWIMSLIGFDMDQDGDMDIAASDRKGPSRGCLWLENPGPGLSQDRPWTVHRIADTTREVMFMDLADLDGDGLIDVLATTAGKEIVWHRRRSTNGDEWETHVIPIPTSAGTGKSVRVGDVDLDGRPDIVFSCEHAQQTSGVMWLEARGPAVSASWLAHDISGPSGIKFDLVQLIDLDEDGDLDAITTEEVEGLGVIWYENPIRSGPKQGRQ